MSTLLVWREKLQRTYANYSVYIDKGLQLALGLLVFGTINHYIGYMETAASVYCTAGLAVICAFLPLTAMVICAAALVLIHFYALSLPVTVISIVLFLIMYIFYFRFGTGKGWLVLAAALAFAFRIPLVLPVVFGLMGTAVWIVPASCGIFSYYLIAGVRASSAALGNAGEVSLLDGLTAFAKQALMNREMWMMILVVVLGTLVVNVLSLQAFSHAWKVASAAGPAVCVIAASVGNMSLNLHISYAMIVISALLGVGIGIVLEFFFFSVDYSGTEHVQFEDDEYYYYVTAVPKVDVTIPEIQVKRITGDLSEGANPDASGEDGAGAKIPEPEPVDKGKTSPSLPVSDINIAKNTEEILLTRSLSKELGLDDNKNPQD